ncbi:MAG: Hpt domain-containing protein, partial [Pseudoalteromonas sp.]
TQILRQNYTSQQLPIFALTAHCEAEDEARAIAAGMNKHLTKPIVANTLLEAISAVKIGKPAFFDVSFALSQFAGDSELLQVMLNKLADLCESHLANLDSERPPADIEKIVHNIKGVTGNLGFVRLSELAQRLEITLRKTSEVDYNLYNELIIELQQVYAFIQVRNI